MLAPKWSSARSLCPQVGGLCLIGAAALCRWLWGIDNVPLPAVLAETGEVDGSAPATLAARYGRARRVSRPRWMVAAASIPELS